MLLSLWSALFGKIFSASPAPTVAVDAVAWKAIDLRVQAKSVDVRAQAKTRDLRAQAKAIDLRTQAKEVLN